mmetsp:Transcript_118109/g.329287  ORF Transcript_118109/g.329287 Transcript_118109/m.329287 type:complete len:312 (+) Transcript_118109:230-1165(+)
MLWKHLLRQWPLAEHVALGGGRRGPLRPRQSPMAGARVLCQVSFPHGWAGLAEHSQGYGPDDARHQRQVLQLLVRREELLAGVELHQDAPNGPEVGALIPAERQQDLRPTVLPSVDDGGVVLVLVRRVPKVYELDPAARGPQVLARGLALRRGRGAVSPEPLGFAREVALVRRLHRLQQDVLGLEVGMRHSEISVQEHEGLHALLREALDVLHPEPSEGVALQEVVERGPQRLKHQAVEPLVMREGLVHDCAARVAVGVCLADVLENVRLDLGVVHVALHVADDLYGDLAVAALVVSKHDAAEGAVAKQLD